MISRFGHPRSSVAGFTLLEVVMVLSIFAVLVAVLLYAVGDIRASQSIKIMAKDHTNMVSKIRQNGNLINQYSKQSSTLANPTGAAFNFLNSLEALPPYKSIPYASSDPGSLLLRMKNYDLNISIQQQREFLVTYGLPIATATQTCTAFMQLLGYTSQENLKADGIDISNTNTNLDFTLITNGTQLANFCKNLPGDAYQKRLNLLYYY